MARTAPERKEKKTVPSFPPFISFVSFSLTPLFCHPSPSSGAFPLPHFASLALTLSTLPLSFTWVILCLSPFSPPYPVRLSDRFTVRAIVSLLFSFPPSVGPSVSCLFIQTNRGNDRVAGGRVKGGGVKGGRREVGGGQRGDGVGERGSLNTYIICFANSKLLTVAVTCGCLRGHQGSPFLHHFFFFSSSGPGGPQGCWPPFRQSMMETASERARAALWRPCVGKKCTAKGMEKRRGRWTRTNFLPITLVTLRYRSPRHPTGPRPPLPPPAIRRAPAHIPFAVTIATL